MVDTFFCKIDLLVNGQERINDLCPVVIEHTTKNCGENAVSLAWIICGTIVVIALLIIVGLIIWRSIDNNNKQKTNKLNWNNQERDRCYKLKSDYQTKLLDEFTSYKKVWEYIDGEKKKNDSSVKNILEKIDGMLANNNQTQYFRQLEQYINELNNKIAELNTKLQIKTSDGVKKK